MKVFNHRIFEGEVYFELGFTHFLEIFSENILIRKIFVSTEASLVVLGMDGSITKGTELREMRI